MPSCPKCHKEYLVDGKSLKKHVNACTLEGDYREKKSKVRKGIEEQEVLPASRKSTRDRGSKSTTSYVEDEEDEDSDAVLPPKREKVCASYICINHVCILCPLSLSASPV
jgi:hypothetical protein